MITLSKVGKYIRGCSKSTASHARNSFVVVELLASDPVDPQTLQANASVTGYVPEFET